MHDEDTETLELFRRAAKASGAERAALLDQIVERHLGLADSLAKRYWRTGQDIDDLKQVARIGLVEATQRFDPGRGTFIGFAVPTITGLLKRHFRDHVWMVRPPRQTQELVVSVRQEWSRVAQETGQEPTCGQLADHLKIPRSSVSNAELASDCYRPAALPPDETLFASASTQSEFDRCEARTIISGVLRQLEPAERELIRLRYFDLLSQQAIAARTGTNQMHVSRQLSRLLAKMRNLVGPLDEVA